MDDGRSTHAFQLEQIEVLDVLCRQLLEGDSSLAEVRRDNTLHGCCVGSVCSDCDGAFHDVKPLLHVISEKYVSLYRFFGLELLTFFHQKGFGLFLVALHSETGGDPLGLSLSKGIVVIQDGIVIAVFFSKVSCYHFINPPILNCRTTPTDDRGSIISPCGFEW